MISVIVFQTPEFCYPFWKSVKEMAGEGVVFGHLRIEPQIQLHFISAFPSLQETHKPLCELSPLPFYVPCIFLEAAC